MPHILVDHSGHLATTYPIGALVDALHEAALGFDTVPSDALRTRAHASDHSRVATGDPSFAYVAITVRLGPGRDADTKEQLMVALLDTAESFFSADDAAQHHIAFSCEVQEIDAAARINRNHVRVELQGRQP